MSSRLPAVLLRVRHIGPRRAQRLVDGLGWDWFALIDTDPERVFATLRGLGRRRARVAADSWRAQLADAQPDATRTSTHGAGVSGGVGACDHERCRCAAQP